MALAVASRYARALADLVLDPSRGLPPEKATAELDAFEQVAGSSVDLRNVLLSPAVSPARKRAVVARLAGQLEMSPLLRNFLYVIIDHRRTAMLAEIREAFQALIDERTGAAEAEVKACQAFQMLSPIGCRPYAAADSPFELRRPDAGVAQVPKGIEQRAAKSRISGYRTEDRTRLGGKDSSENCRSSKRGQGRLELPALFPSHAPDQILKSVETDVGRRSSLPGHSPLQIGSQKVRAHEDSHRREAVVLLEFRNFFEKALFQSLEGS